LKQTREEDVFEFDTEKRMDNGLRGSDCREDEERKS
jgi:hypothetical protein